MVATKQVHTNLDFNNVGRVTGLADGTSAGDAVTKRQLDSAVEGIKSKEGVRVATTANINLASAPSSIDGVTLAANNRVLVKDQTTASQNGIYVYNGSGSAMTRAIDANTVAEMANAVVSVFEGTANASSVFRQTTVTGVIDTANIAWTAMSGAVPDATTTTPGKVELATQGEVDAGTDPARVLTPETFKNSSLRIKKYAVNIGDGTETLFTVTHNLGTLDVQVSIFANSGGDEVLADVTHTTTNALTVEFSAAPTNNQYRVVVIG